MIKNIWKKHYCLPQVMLIIVLMITIASILHVVSLNVIHEQDIIEDIIINNDDIKQLFETLI